MAAPHDVSDALAQCRFDRVRLSLMNPDLSTREGHGRTVYGIGTGAGHDADERIGHGNGLAQRRQVEERASSRRLSQILACSR